MGLLNGRRVLIIILAVYLASIFYNPQDIRQHRKSTSLIGPPTLFYGDGYRYYQLTKTIVESGRLSVYDNISVIDHPIVLSSGVGGKIYIPFEPGLSFLAVPFYMLLGPAGLYLMNTLLGFLTCCIIFLTSRLYVSEKAASYTTLFFGLGSAILTYSEVFYSDILSAALVAGAFYLLLKHMKTGGRTEIISAGLLCGILPLTKPTLILVTLAFLAYVCYFRSVKSGALLLLGFTLTVWIYFAYNTFCFGSPLATGYDSITDVIDGRTVILDLNSPQYWRNNPIKTIPLLTAIMVFTSPVLLISAVGLIKTKSRESLLVVIIFAALALTYGFRHDSIGGWCWGWRLMLPLVPLLALPAAHAIERKLLSERVLWIIFYLSLYLTLLSLAPVAWHVQTRTTLVEAVNYNPLV